MCALSHEPSLAKLIVEKTIRWDKAHALGNKIVTFWKIRRS